MSPDRRVNFTEQSQCEVFLPDSAFLGVSKFQVSCDRDEMPQDARIILKTYIDNTRCNIPVGCLVVRLLRVLKYRMDWQNTSQEHILKAILCEKRLPGLAANSKDLKPRDVKLVPDNQPAPIVEFAQALQDACIDLLDYI